MNLEKDFHVYNTDKHSKSTLDNWVHIRPLSDSIANLQYWFDALNTQLEQAKEENQYLKSEKYKDDELAQMKQQVDLYKQKADESWADSMRGFPITEDENKKIHNWMKLHDATIHSNPKSYHGASGGGYSYEFYPTGIGTSGVCVCDVCRRHAYDLAYRTGTFNREMYNEYMRTYDGSFEFQELG